MVTDAPRVDAYTRAMQAVITPGSFVIEIGTGIGVFAVLASRMGARRVVAIEPSDAIAVARMIAKDNGEPGIEFIQGLSTGVSFAEKADVVVSDLRGVLPLFDGHLQSIVDARERLLAPGGALIPAADTLCVAVVELPHTYGERTPAFSADGTVKLDVMRRFMTNTWEKVRFKPEQLLTKAEPWATIDYRTVSGRDVNGTARLTTHRDGQAHGLAVWFDATLVDGVTFSNAPDQPELVYGAAFFPWPEPVDVRQGATICVRFDARHIGEEYLWRWDSDVFAGDSPITRKARFQQSTFYGQPIAPAKLAKGAASQAAALSEDGHIERFILQSMDGMVTNQDIARRLMERFPRLFAQFNDALGRVGSVARRFGLD
jgi:protein arginine N-methyltransferase 1